MKLSCPSLISNWVVSSQGRRHVMAPR
jgi:hypothetical protein